jgi:hypothetical protein
MDETTIFRWVQLASFAGGGLPALLSRGFLAFPFGFNAFAKAIC